MNARRRRTRRMLRRGWRRCLRVVRRHHLTLLSAVVLATALGLALTSQGLDTAGPAPPAEAAASDVAPALPAEVAAQPRVPRQIVFYVTDSLEQIQSLQQSLADDSRYHALYGDGQGFSERNYFLLITTAEEEAQAILFINDLVELSFLDDAQIRVYDVRQ